MNPDREVLITGAGGALAQMVISRLKDHYKIVAVDFRHQPQIGSKIRSYKVDFNKREFEDIFRTHDIGTVIHLGRISSSQLSRERRYNANVLGTQRLLDFCIQYNVESTLVLSTFHVYGANPYNPALIDEDAPLKAAELTMDLVDSVELENLANIYLWKAPQINVSILRPCHILGPGINNTMSRLFLSKYAPYLTGFSPMMQFIHIEDMADAVVLALKGNKRGIYNVAPDDWVSYTKALKLASCKKLPIPSLPASAPKFISRLLDWGNFPAHLVAYYKYPVVIDGSQFRDNFNFEPRYSLREIFTYYKERK